MTELPDHFILFFLLLIPKILVFYTIFSSHSPIRKPLKDGNSSRASK